MGEPGFAITVRVDFSAAHHIRGYEGDCARPHGHNYVLEVTAATPRLNEIGIAMDFKDLKRMLKELISRFDHQDLNTIPPFTEINPTAETLARHFFEELSKGGLALRNVTVWENERSAASFGFA